MPFEMILFCSFVPTLMAGKLDTWYFFLKHKCLISIDYSLSRNFGIRTLLWIRKVILITIIWPSWCHPVSPLALSDPQNNLDNDWFRMVLQHSHRLLYRPPVQALLLALFHHCSAADLPQHTRLYSHHELLCFLLIPSPNGC